MEQINMMRDRMEIPEEDKWSIKDLYETDALWEEDLNTLEADKDELVSYAGRLGESADNLLKYLRLTEVTEVKVGRLANYCMRKSDEDTRNSVYQAMVGKFMSIAVALSAATSFETPDIMAIPDDVLA